MLICGVKVTHDGGVAVVDNGRLLMSVEVEKLDNRHRYTELDQLELIERVLADHGLRPGDIDRFVLDGWGYGKARPTVMSTAGGQDVGLVVAPYREGLGEDGCLANYPSGGLLLAGREYGYSSYHHTTGHVLSAYCASPFAAAGEPSFVVVWDGGVLPRAYYVRPDTATVEALGPIFGLIGNVYAGFAMHFPPFNDASGPQSRHRQLSVPGKVMAYTALGRVDPDLMPVFDAIYADELDISLDFADTFAKSFNARTGERVAPPDALASFQHWLGRQLVSSLRDLRANNPDLVGNLCFSGGCALNIKWNGLIRASTVFDRFWVPPFPNDSGSAIGAACAEMVTATGQTRLDWSTYSGPAIQVGPVTGLGYHSRDCSVPELAQLLHDSGEAVVVLHGRAELGPRALGNRSILAAPTTHHMKDQLNDIKAREHYRPVSPICLTDSAPEIFDPGTPDPYMLFDHQIRPEWVDRIPAVRHLDGSARLQTVDHTNNPLVAELITEYARLSGVPVLCNTSANLNGRGFFPDVASALTWGRTRYVWSDGVLWERADPSVDEMPASGVQS